MKTDRLGKILLSKVERMILLLVMSIACTSIASAATYIVTKTADTNGTCNSGVDCSLREAIAAANSTPDNDTINFNIPTSDSGCSGGVCTITLNSSLGQLTINSASTSGTLTIRKSAATTQKIEISGNNAIRVFVVNSGANLTIENITVRNGLASTGSGGGIRNNGTTTIINSTVSNNSASPDGGGILNNSGAIVTIINSTVSNNSAPTVGGFGGGIRNDGTVTIINSTISNNSTSGNGGGILNFGTVNAQNTIIANNSASLAAPDFGGTLTSQGYNLIGNTSGTTIAGTTTGNILNQDPKLAPLGDYGGLTKTHALLLGSPALNAGSNSLALDQNGNALTMDQRGAARISGGTVDIGAYEQRVAVVTNTNDSGSGSLRNEATGSPFGGLITFNISGCPGNVCVITLSSQISITGAVIITNESSTQRIEISGNNATRVFQVNSGANLTINNVTVRNGSGVNGGGIRNFGMLTMINCTVSGNGGSDGGGISNVGTLTMTNCTVSGNSASAGAGGGIANGGTLTMTNCTVSGNSTFGFDGGGILNYGGATLTMTNCTVSGNSAVGGGFGGGIANFATLNLNNSIVANNSASNGPDISGAVSSGDFNLIKDTSGISGMLPGSNNITGQDPKLAPLGNYGGPTQTQPPLPNSPVINAGSNALIPTGVSTDQRGALRIAQTNVDIGAVEITTRTVTSINDSGPGTLRDILLGNQGIADIIKFNITSGCSGGVCVITLSSTLVANPGVGLLYITNEGGAQRIEISGNNATRVFVVNSGANLTINNITVRNGKAFGGGGGGIYNDFNATLTMINCTVSGNNADGSGGGINNSGTLTMINCTVSGNSAPGLSVGGGIFNPGTLTMINCTVSGNSAALAGGGIRNAGTITIINSTISNNSAGSYGGGGVSNDGTVNARNTIIANNSALSGGPDFSGTLTSQGYNLIRNTSGMSGTVSTDITGVNPYLTPLGYYGGPTQTRALMRFYLGPVWSKSLYADNPAINSGDNCVKIPNCSTLNPSFAITTDQRGAPRNVVEIGAYEISNFAASLPNATVSQSYEFTISQYSATEGNFTYIMSGLPTGLSLTQSVSSGVVTVKITGTPGQSGNFTPILTISDSTGRFERVVYTLNVASGMGVKVSGKEF